MPRTKTGLTHRELKVLEYITDYKQRRGYAPSIAEISDHLNLSSKSLVHYYLNNLENAGKIKRDPRVSRSIIVLEGA